MTLKTGFGALLLALASIPAGFAQDRPLANFDKKQIESYLRYAEAFQQAVRLSIDDPAPSIFPNFFQFVVHISLGEQQRMDKVYYITADGREIIDGRLWDTLQSPFAATLKQLPANGPSFGPAGAKVTIVIFSDFQCPYCRELARTIRQNIPKLYPNDVRVMFADFPLEAIHPWAYAMAEAAHCVAGDNDASFWAFHDWVYQHQQEITKDNLKQKVLAYANDQHLDAVKIGSCIDTHATGGIVKQQQQLGKLLQVDQTPTLFINGREMAGARPWENIDAVIKLELARARELAGPGGGTK